MLHPFFYVGPGAICGVLLTVTVEVKELDSNGLWNHLLLSKRTPPVACGGEDGRTKLVVSGEAHMSWSQVKDPLPFEEGQTFQGWFNAQCSSGYGVSELPGSGIEAQYRSWICDINEMEIAE